MKGSDPMRTTHSHPDRRRAAAPASGCHGATESRQLSPSGRFQGETRLEAAGVPLLLHSGFSLLAGPTVLPPLKQGQAPGGSGPWDTSVPPACAHPEGCAPLPLEDKAWQVEAMGRSLGPPGDG